MDNIFDNIDEELLAKAFAIYEKEFDIAYKRWEESNNQIANYWQVALNNVGK